MEITLNFGSYTSEDADHILSDQLVGIPQNEKAHNEIIKEVFE
jgi:hypothetical protein